MLLTITAFIIILSLLVFIHELGHFLIARWIGVKVEEFGFGLPPRAIGKKIKGTIYSLNWLPIGGFVKLAGENDGEIKNEKLKIKNVGEYFWARTKKERGAILLAGVGMNFLLAVALTTYLLMSGVHISAGRVHVEKLVPGAPAEKAGLKEQDIIKNIKYQIPALPAGGSNIKYGEKEITIPKELVETVRAHSGEQVVFTVLRDEAELKIPVVPRKDYPPDEGPTGIAISDLEIKKYPWWEALPQALKINILRARDMLIGIVATAGKLLSGKSVESDVAGPIGIAQVTGRAVKFGFKAVLEFASILSLNLAVLNVLPIPALDGGRFAFVFVEKLLGKKIKPAFERQAHQWGMLILLLLVLLVSVNDILRLARGS